MTRATSLRTYLARRFRRTTIILWISSLGLIYVLLFGLSGFQSFWHVDRSAFVITSTHKAVLMRSLEQPKYQRFRSPWSWTCGRDGLWHRVIVSPKMGVMSLESCWLTCGTYRTLWPRPGDAEVQVSLGSGTLEFQLENLHLLHVHAPSDEVHRLAEEAFEILKRNTKNLYPKDFGDRKTGERFGRVEVSLFVQTNKHKLSLLTDEKYRLLIQEKEPGSLLVSILGQTFFGLRHGLETLTQLIVFDDFADSLKILKEVELNDGPAFPYRGIMIDTARNFIPIASLKKVVDGMAQNKLNIFYWHLTDSNSFPIYCPSYPQMTNYGAYSKDEIYYPEEVKDFIHYAQVRGIIVVPELDIPAHAGNGWQWGDETNGYGKLALCVNETPERVYCGGGQPICGHLNPINPKVDEVLYGIYRDLLPVFDSDLFHMGGDEVNYFCWDTKEINSFVALHNMTLHESLKTHFQIRALEALRMAHASQGNHDAMSPVPILWNLDVVNAFTELQEKNTGLSATECIIQLWQGVPLNDSEARAIVDASYPVIVSNVDFLYLDFGNGAWRENSQDFKTINWQVLYQFDFDSYGYNTSKRVLNSKFGEIPQVLGGEATLWSEKVNQDTMHARLWPRAAAFAERLWTNPDITSEDLPEVTARLLHQNERMRMHGIPVDTRQPESCRLINAYC